VSAERAKLITVTQSPPPPEPAPEQVDRPQTQHDRLPVSEVAFDRPGGPSPFGEDIAFPLPTDRLQYRHG
jgi:succinate dehydrogenase / fumarate reductase iron-sulfur subunit